MDTENPLVPALNGFPESQPMDAALSITSQSCRVTYSVDTPPADHSWTRARWV